VAILFDLDGVFYQGDNSLPGGREVVNWANEAGIPYLFLTNTTSKPRQDLVDKLKGFGIRTDVDRILTPAVVAARWCEEQLPGGAVALFVPDSTASEFSALPITDEGDVVAAVIVGDLGESWDFHRLNDAFRLLMTPQKPKLIALGMTRYWQAADGLRLDVAPFVVALAHATGIEPLVTGKPDPAFFASALSLLAAEVSQTVMVGDDVRGDVAGAQDAGLQAVLVQTGKYRESDLSSGIVPDGVLATLDELPSWYERRFGSA
jgi:HAD superfamily hydrolase (TIGR01458 family)